MNPAAMSRRELFRIGATGILGWSLPEMLALQASGEARHRVRAKNVLVILEQGGLSHIDTWDPKPETVAEHRSPYRSISTSVPGLRFTELLSRTARVAHRLTVVRSMYHARGGANGHPTGTQYMLSGSHPAGSLPMPDIGSVVAQHLGTPCKALPPYVMVPGNDEQAGVTTSGFLPAALRAFKTGGADLSAPGWKVNALQLHRDNTRRRLEGRRDLLSALETGPDGRHGQLSVNGMDRFYAQAFDTLTTPQVSRAFDLKTEPDKLREEYGSGHRGACYLLGRKLIEAGVRFVTVDVRWPLTKETPGGFNLNWDHHDLMYANGSCGTVRNKAGGEGRYGIGTWPMMGSTDRAFAALINDMHQRGLLAETLVCFITEFGRTPKLNKFQGRDHWTNAYSIVFAGAGTPGGQAIGATDKAGGEVVSEPHTPEEYAATVYEKLGIDRSKPLYTSSNRPVYIGGDAEPIMGVV